METMLKKARSRVAAEAPPPRSRAVRVLACVALALPVLTGGTGGAWGQSLYYDRSEVPGNYTLGLYADPAGQSRHVELEPGQESVEVHIGITGDSTRVFSAIVFALDLPEGIRLEGPIRWRAIEGLTQWGSPVDAGVQVEFNKVCQEQTGSEPVMVGRIRFAVDPEFESGEITVTGHRRWGVSVELCKADEYWPKPYATGLGVTVERKKSLWGKVRGLFD